MSSDKPYQTHGVVKTCDRFQ